MYILTSLQLIQAQAKLSNSYALMISYQGKHTPDEIHEQLDKNIKENGIWNWLKNTTTPEVFAKLRVQACMDTELFIFDININHITIKTNQKETNWRYTLINPDGTLKK